LDQRIELLPPLAVQSLQQAETVVRLPLIQRLVVVVVAELYT
jgi:hypothetical protein